MEHDLQARATRIVDDLAGGRPVDFVSQAAARLPVEVICDLMGIPARHHQMVLDRSNVILGYSDPEYNGIAPGDRYLHSTPRRRDMAMVLARVVKSRPGTTCSGWPSGWARSGAGARGTTSSPSWWPPTPTASR